jgi:hypothetical protein
MKRFLAGILGLLLTIEPAFSHCRIAQSTSGTVKLGAFVDDTDFKTAETALTIQKADVRLSKNGGNMAAASADQGASDVGAPHDELGFYDISYNTTDSDTEGNLLFVVKESGALVVWKECEVYAPLATIQDLFNFPKASVDDTDGIGYWLKTNADVPTSQYSVVKNRTTIATLASQTSWTLTGGSADDNAYNGWLVVVEDQASGDQKAVGVVEDYTGSTRTVTLRTDPAVFTMAIGDVVYLIPDRSLKPTVDNRTADVSAGGAVSPDWANVEAPTTVLDLSGTTVKAATDIATLIGATGSGLTSLASQASLDTLDNIVDTEVPAIKAKTDQLTFGTANRVDAQVHGMEADVVNSSAIAATAVTEIQTGLLTVPKNVAYSNFTFKLFLTADGSAGTGLSPTCTISKDGGAFAACANSATEIGSTGVYKINLTQTEMNADELWLTFSAATARVVDFKIRTLK